MKQTIHRRITHHMSRGVVAVLLGIALVGVRLDAAGGLADNGSVLAYASEMSRSGLLDGTNAARSANGLGPLALNSQLNNAAQAKAQHMATNDYWAHVAPDGTQPWYFFDQAGYVYSKAGENLAYGFNTSQSAINGWMNSPGHKANILGEYIDVGFGIVNAPSYQGRGEQTIVVAHYGTRRSAAPAAPAPAAPAPVAPSAPQPPQQPAPADVPNPSETSQQNQPEAQKNESPESERQTPTAPDANRPSSETQEPAQAAPLNEQRSVMTSDSEHNATVLGLMANRQLPAAALLSLTAVSLSIMGYATLHRRAFEHALISGEKFAVRHPSLDAAIVASITALILLTSYGTIR